jgi:hypothetical protein
MSPPAAGYSGTPLARKLGIGEGSCVLAIDAPADYRQILAPVPLNVAFAGTLSTRVDVIHLFVAKRGILEKQLASLRKRIRPDAAVWVSWPKKASKLPSEVDENIIRSVALPMGYVDVKVCAVTETWSGLKLVVRKELRTS